MARHGFGRGEYQYFAYPLPSLLAALRPALYRRLQPIANRWHAAMGLPTSFPADHAEFLARCHAAGQLCARYDAHILYLKTALCACLRSDITRRKHEQNIQFFDDLLLRVHESLNGPGGTAWTRIPSGPRSAARYRTDASSAALATPITL